MDTARQTRNQTERRTPLGMQEEGGRRPPLQGPNRDIAEKPQSRVQRTNREGSKVDSSKLAERTLNVYENKGPHSLECTLGRRSETAPRRSKLGRCRKALKGPGLQRTNREGGKAASSKLAERTLNVYENKGPHFWNAL